MNRFARFALRYCYFYGILIGVLSFEFDFRRNRLVVTRRAKIWCAFANICLTGIVPLLYFLNIVNDIRRNIKYLYEQVFIFVSIVRTFGVLLTFVSNWSQRKEFINVARALIRLHRFHFRALYIRSAGARKIYEKVILLKYISSSFSELTSLVMALNAIRYIHSVRMFFCILIIWALTTTLNMVFTHYYFAITNLYVNYYLLREELSSIWSEASVMMERQQQRVHKRGISGVYVTQCCQLADRLDALALAERQLHDISDRINTLYSFQGIIVLIILYLLSVSVAFFIYCVTKYSIDGLGWTYWGISLTAIYVITYYSDVNANVFLIFGLLEIYQECKSVLQQHLTLPKLDVRLEESFERFTLQMQCRPLVMSTFGIYEFNKYLMFSIFGSLMQHVIVLIQYDIKINSLSHM